MSGFSLTFLTRSGCHLCDSAEPLIRRLAIEFGVPVVVQNVDADPVLLDKYTTRVPVLLGSSGRVLAEGVIDEETLRKALAAELSPN